MTAHTNVQIPERHREIQDQLYATKQEAERKFWQETAEYLILELQNIPSAIAQYGYVTLPDGTKLIPEPLPPLPGQTT